MRVFVTGATGFIGSAIVSELLEHGHEVLGLARSDRSAEALASTGAAVHRGDLTDLESLRRGAEVADGVIHTAFVHDFDRLAESGPIDQRAVTALGAAGKPLVITSGTAALAPGATEDDEPDRSGPGKHRLPSEDIARPLGSIVRLPPTVHGEGDHGFVPRLVEIARESGVSAYPGDGSNRWAAVHRLDAARLFRLALESAPVGSILHGVGEEGVPTRAIAEAIGRGLDLPVEAREAEHFGWLGVFFAADVPATSALTRERLGWTPTGPTLLEDLEAGSYFSVAPAVR